MAISLEYASFSYPSQLFTYPKVQSNVLIDGQGKACLGDFGMSTIIAIYEGSNSFLSTSIGGAIRWADVQLYSYDQEGYFPTLNVNTDIYSFGSVMLQVREDIWC